MTKIGKNIKKIRNIKGLSQQAFADLLGLTRGNISSYEEGRAEPKIETILKIANDFSIPVVDFIQKDLSVNELLHYNTNLVVETDQLKITQQLVKVPYIPSLYINDYIKNFANPDFTQKLPYLIIPSNSKFDLIGIELDNQEHLPAGYDYNNGNVLIFENVVKENIHRIIGRLGIMFHSDEIKWGIYKSKEGKIVLSLNDWVEYDFDIESESPYRVLKAVYRQEN